MEAFFDRGEDAGEIAKDPLVGGVAAIGGDVMGEFVFLDMLCGRFGPHPGPFPKGEGSFFSGPLPREREAATGCGWR